MKRFVILVLSLVLVLGCVSTANGEHSDFACRGIVICTNVTIRNSPSTSASSYGQLHNGDVVHILYESNGWYAIDLATTGLTNSGGVGYAKSSLIKAAPYWIVLTSYTPVYADPWYTGNSNGELSTNTPLLVISENDDFFCVQTHTGVAGASFVRKNDVGRITSEFEQGWAVIVKGDATFITDNGYGTIKKNKLVQISSWGEPNSYVFYDGYYGWIDSDYLQPVIN